MAEIDPRLEGVARSLNEEVLRGTIRHGVNLERLKNQLVRDTIVFLNDQVFPDIVAKIQSRLERLAFGEGVWTTKRYQDLLELISQMTKDGMAETHVRLEAQLDKLAAQEATWQKKHIDESVGVDIGFDLPSPEILKQIVRDQPFAGMVTKDWFEKLDTNTADRLVQQVNIGLAQGETVDLMVQRIRGTKENAYADGVLETTRHEAEAIVRTAATHVTAQAREATYRENTDVISGVMWTATLDDVTCPICGKLDGQVFPVGEGQRPPAHWNCRCEPDPVLKTWQELGIDLKEAPPGTRASANGEVPDAMSYEDWLKGEPVHVQENALGVTRAKLFRDGDLTLGQFSDDRGHTLTLDQLAQKEGVEIPDQYRKTFDRRGSASAETPEPDSGDRIGDLERMLESGPSPSRVREIKKELKLLRGQSTATPSSTTDVPVVNPTTIDAFDSTTEDQSLDLGRELAGTYDASTRSGHRYVETESALIDQDASKLVVRDGNGDIVAAMSYRVDEEEVTISHLGSITPGNGRRLVDQAIAVAREHGLPVRLESSDEAVEFYKRLGFVAEDPKLPRVLTLPPNRMRQSGEATAGDLQSKLKALKDKLQIEQLKTWTPARQEVMFGLYDRIDRVKAAIKSLPAGARDVPIKNVRPASSGTKDEIHQQLSDLGDTVARARSTKSILGALRSNEMLSRVDLSDLEDIPLEAMKGVASAAIHAAEASPSTVDKFLGIFLRDVERGPGGGYGSYASQTEIGGKTAIALNKKLYASPSGYAKLKGGMKRDFDVEWGATQQGESVITHEFGHVLEDAPEFSKAKAYAKGHFGELAKADKTDAEMLVSEYAMTNWHEAFAESWAAIVHNEPNSWSPWIRGFLKSIQDGYKKAGRPMPGFLQEKLDGVTL